MGFSLVVESGDYSLDAVHSLLIMVASLDVQRGLESARASVVVAPGLSSTGSVVVVNGLSCFLACGILPDQGSNSCLLHWQAGSLPLSHQGSPPVSFSYCCMWYVIVDLAWYTWQGNPFTEI